MNRLSTKRVFAVQLQWRQELEVTVNPLGKSKASAWPDLKIAEDTDAGPLYHFSFYTRPIPAHLTSLSRSFNPQHSLTDPSQHRVLRFQGRAGTSRERAQDRPSFPHALPHCWHDDFLTCAMFFNIHTNTHTPTKAAPPLPRVAPPKPQAGAPAQDEALENGLRPLRGP